MKQLELTHPSGLRVMLDMSSFVPQVKTAPAPKPAKARQGKERFPVYITLEEFEALPKDSEVYPSTWSVHHYKREYKQAYIDAFAVIKAGGRVYVNPELFDEVTRMVRNRPRSKRKARTNVNKRT
jgi:hypothetical protein